MRRVLRRYEQIVKFMLNKQSCKIKLANRQASIFDGLFYLLCYAVLHIAMQFSCGNKISYVVKLTKPINTARIKAIKPSVCRFIFS
jgi:hypothetical protein